MAKKKKDKKNKAEEKKSKGSKTVNSAVSVRELLRVGSGFDLSAVDTRRIVAGPDNKEEARAKAAELETEVTDLQRDLPPPDAG